MAGKGCTATVDSRRRETVQHGSTLFPIAFYEDDMHKFSVPWHWHDELECIVATEGLVVVLVEGTKLLLHPGEGVFINSGALHAVEAGSSGASILHSIVFHPRLIGGSLDSIFWQRLITPLVQDKALRHLFLDPNVPWQAAFIRDILDVWNWGTEQQDDYENFIRYRLSSAFRLLAENRPAARKPKQQDQLSAQRMKDMLRYIEEHYCDDLTLEQIAGSACVSSSVCLRCFRQMLGTAPMQYVKHLRIEKSAQLLLSTQWKVQQIALECGFSDVSYFTKIFREEKGCPPRQYRANYQP